MGQVWLGISLALAVFLVSTIYTNPNLIERNTILFYADLLEEYKVPYTWGGFFGLFGVDCSGANYYVVSKVKPVKRTTAFRMWLKYGNWTGKTIEGKDAFDSADPTDILFFSYKSEADHTALAREHKNIKDKRVSLEMSEASFSAGYYKRTTIKKNDGRYTSILGVRKLDL
jgi:cell wall-associated NlpC family hydrolase